MINSNIDYNITPGSIVTPVYEWNAQIMSGSLDILDENGNIISGRSTDAGDKIIVLNIFTSQNVTLIQYPTPEGHRQGYVENTLLNEVASYRFRNWWQNGSTSQQILQNNGQALTTLPAYSPATILFEADGYTCIAYGDGNGMPNQSGFSAYGGMFGGIQPKKNRDYPANAETTAQSIAILDYNEDPLTGRYTTLNDPLTVLDVLKNGELILIQYPAEGGYRKGFIKNYAQSNFVFNNWDNFTNNTNQNITVYNNSDLTDAINTIAPQAKATILFEVGNTICVTYNTSEGLHIGSGYIDKAYGAVSNPFKVGDEVEILESAVWFATGPAVGDRQNDIFIVMEKINIDLENNESVAYTIKDCRTNEEFNVYPQDIEETKERPVVKPTHPKAQHTNHPTQTTGNQGHENHSTGVPSSGNNTNHSTGTTSNGGSNSQSHSSDKNDTQNNTPAGKSPEPISGGGSNIPTGGTNNTGSSSSDGGQTSGSINGNIDINLSGGININVNNEELQSNFTKQIDNLEKNINGKFDEIETQISSENNTTKNLENSINTLQDVINTFISEAKSTDNEMNSEIQNIKASTLNLQNDLTLNKNNILANTQEISDIKSKISSNESNIEVIGGINLINRQPSSFGASGSTSSDYGFSWAGVDLTAGKTYTFTACGCSSQEAINNGQFLCLQLYDENWENCYSLSFKETIPTVKQVTFTVPKTDSFIITCYAMPKKSNSKNTTVYWYNVQEGEIGTAWVPSLYDLNLKNGEEF